LIERQRGYTEARDSAVRRLRRGQSLGGGNSRHGTSYTTVASFVDTNILACAEDRDAKKKHEAARDPAIRSASG
jgi:hypothetical protein